MEQKSFSMGTLLLGFICRFHLPPLALTGEIKKAASKRNRRKWAARIPN